MKKKKGIQYQFREEPTTTTRFNLNTVFKCFVIVPHYSWVTATTTTVFDMCSYLRSGLQISEGNDFFVDKKLNGLLLPVVHVAVKLISVHT